MQAQYSIDDDHHLFMTIASVIARKSDCIEKNGIAVGACIVNEEKQIVGIGYNKLVEGSEDLHAEKAAFDNATLPIENCILYVTRHPCIDCAELIRANKIKKVFYNGEIPTGRKYANGKKFLEISSIPCEPYSSPNHIYIDYSESIAAYDTNISNLAEDLNDVEN